MSLKFINFIIINFGNHKSFTVLFLLNRFTFIALFLQKELLTVHILIFLACCSFSSNMSILFLLRLFNIILALALFWMSIKHFLSFRKIRLLKANILSLIWFFRFFFLFGIFISIFFLFFIFLFSFQVILGEVAVLTESIWIVRFIFMATSTCHFRLAFSVVAIMAHIFSIMLFVQVMTQKHFSFLLSWNFWSAHSHYSILLIKSLHLKAAYSIIFKYFFISQSNIFKLLITYLLLKIFYQWYFFFVRICIFLTIFFNLT